MKELRANGVKIAIVTSSNEMKMNNAYKAHPELKQSVDRILTAEMFTRSKPDPECFLLGATVFDTVPENCVVFEDSFHGLEAGNRAGMTVIGLATTNLKSRYAIRQRLLFRTLMDLVSKNEGYNEVMSTKTSTFAAVFYKLK